MTIPYDTLKKWELIHLYRMWTQIVQGLKYLDTNPKNGVFFKSLQITQQQKEMHQASPLHIGNHPWENKKKLFNPTLCPGRLPNPFWPLVVDSSSRRATKVSGILKNVFGFVTSRRIDLLNQNHHNPPKNLSNPILEWGPPTDRTSKDDLIGKRFQKKNVGLWKKGHRWKKNHLWTCAGEHKTKKKSGLKSSEGFSKNSRRCSSCSNKKQVH